MPGTARSVWSLATGRPTWPPTTMASGSSRRCSCATGAPAQHGCGVHQAARRPGAARPGGRHAVERCAAVDAERAARQRTLQGSAGRVVIRARIRAQRCPAVELGGSLACGDGTYMQSYYGVTPQPSATSVYPVSSPAPGLRDPALSTGVVAELAADRVGFVNAGISQALGPVLDSPLSSAAGLRHQCRAGLALLTLPRRRRRQLRASHERASATSRAMPSRRVSSDGYLRSSCSLCSRSTQTQRP
jgi:hypothetical protein